MTKPILQGKGTTSTQMSLSVLISRSLLYCSFKVLYFRIHSLETVVLQEVLCQCGFMNEKIRKWMTQPTRVKLGEGSILWLDQILHSNDILHSSDS